MARIIAHIDLDAFFASVEELDKPYLRGLPVVIGADPKGGRGRGVVSTANYAARRYGIHSAQPIREAWRLAENARRRGEAPAAFLTGRHRRYTEVSERIFDIVSTYAKTVERTSIDEAYLDISFMRSYRRAREAMASLREEIYAKTRLTCSIGIGPNRMIAKIASDYEKPNGLTVITPAKAAPFLAPLSIESLPGVGKKTAQALRRRGIATVSDARRYSWEKLAFWFGSHGISLFERAWGVASARIGEARETKSIGKHETFAEDTLDMELVLSTLSSMAERITRKLAQEGMDGFRTVVLTVRFDDFTTVTRSITAKTPMQSAAELDRKAIKLALPFFDASENPERRPIRLVGLRVEKLVHA